jgi:phosphatidylglycerol:prolipoprotein diacylglycerol transferase
VAPTLHLLGLTFQTYPLLLIMGTWIALWVTRHEAPRVGLDGDRVENLVFFALLASILGARIAYVVGHWSAYREGLLAALSPTATALAWPQGALVGLLVGVLYGRRYRLPMGATLDALTPGTALALTVERLGAFLAGKGLGLPAELPWSVHLLDQPRHPVQIYEVLALLVILGMLWKRRGRHPFPGHASVLFVALYSGSRLFLESFRAQTPLGPGGVRIVQVFALLGMLGATGYLYYRQFASDERRRTELPDPAA